MNKFHVSMALALFTATLAAHAQEQGLGNKVIKPGGEVGQTRGEIECRERLGGLLRYYHRKAA